MKQCTFYQLIVFEVITNPYSKYDKLCHNISITPYIYFMIKIHSEICNDDNKVMNIYYYQFELQSTKYSITIKNKYNSDIGYIITIDRNKLNKNKYGVDLNV